MTSSSYPPPTTLPPYSPLANSDTTRTSHTRSMVPLKARWAGRTETAQNREDETKTLRKGIY